MKNNHQFLFLLFFRTTRDIDKGLIELGEHNPLLSRRYWLQNGAGQFRPFREMADNLYYIALRNVSELRQKLKELSPFQRESNLAYRKLDEICAQLEYLTELHTKIRLGFDTQ
ncbi:MAG: hypothetical protein ACXACI_06015 [Candidatus Hodarchaeales archaeon]|jgi:hypothetical protein